MPTVYPCIIYAVFVPYLSFEYICWKIPVVFIYDCQKELLFWKKDSAAFNYNSK